MSPASKIDIIEQATLKQLPVYVCHKRVRALKISEINPTHSGMDIKFEETGCGLHFTFAELEHRPIPQPGMYFVQYENDYFSFSPAEVFESGYTKETP